MTRTGHSRRITRLASILAFAMLAVEAGAPNPTVAAQGSLDPTERAIVKIVDANNAQALALLERLVNINSGTMNFAGVRQVGDALGAQFDSLGFATRWVDGASFHRAGHLIAEHTVAKGAPGAASPRILLIGHLDTVFEPTSPFQHFERVNDTTARGPGVIDMKGGDVIILAAMKALKAVGVLDRLNLTIVFSGDEEKEGFPIDSARYALREAGKRSQFAIGFEDGAGDPHTAIISRRGASGWVVRSNGTPAHSSQIFHADVGAGAIFESARVLDEFRKRLSEQQYLTFNPGVALGGTDVRLDSTLTDGAASGKTNVVAKSMVVSGDIRALSPAQLAAAQQSMRDIVAQHLPLTKSSITFDQGYPPMAPTPGNRRLIALYSTVSRDLGLGPVVAVDPSKAGAADISFVAPYVTTAMDAAGLAGADDHTEKETARLNWLAPQSRRAAVLIYRLGVKNALPVR